MGLPIWEGHEMRDDLKTCVLVCERARHKRQKRIGCSHNGPEADEPDLSR